MVTRTETPRFPDTGKILVTVGAGAVTTTLNRTESNKFPPASSCSTNTSYIPAETDGIVTTNCVGVDDVTVARVPAARFDGGANLTRCLNLSKVKLNPVIVTLEPTSPLAGLTLRTTVGASASIIARGRNAPPLLRAHHKRFSLIGLALVPE